MINTNKITKGLLIFMTCLLFISCTEETKEDPLTSNNITDNDGNDNDRNDDNGNDNDGNDDDGNDGNDNDGNDNDVINGRIGELILNNSSFSTKNSFPVFKGTYTDAEGGIVEVIIINSSDYSNEELNAIPLLVIPGGTGNIVEDQVNPSRLFGHRLGILVGFRGTSVVHDTVGDCKGNTLLIACLKTHPNLPKYTPQQTAQDTIAVLKILAGEKNAMIDGVARNASSFFATNFHELDSYTSSYGGTVLSHLIAALQNEIAPPALRRVAVDSIDAPLEKVISQGFEINLALVNRLFSACEDNNMCNKSFPHLRANLPQWMELHHAGEGVNVTFNGTQYSIHSGNMFDILTYSWETYPDGRQIKPFLTFAGNVIADLSSTNTIIDTSNLTKEQIIDFNMTLAKRTVNEFPPGPYANNFFDLNSPMFIPLLSMNGNATVLEFIDRIGLICSSYILRSNMPDSQEIYDAQLNNATLSPWRYGFLITYRNMFEVCSGLKDTIPSRVAPSNLMGNVEKALVYFGGMDVKHSYESAIEVAANLMNSEIVFEKLRDQGGGPSGTSATDDVFNEFFATGFINQTRVEEVNALGLSPIFK